MTEAACHSNRLAYAERMKEKWHKTLPYIFMLLAALSRWPGLFPQNFSVFYGLAFCAGLYFSRAMAWWLPLGTMMVTDVLLNVFQYHASVFSGYMLLKTGSLALLILLGRCFSRRASFLTLLCGGLLGAILFYFVTNTASWIFNPGYAKSLNGWIQALTSGIPDYAPTWTFFRNTLLSGGLFTGLFVGAMKVTEAAESAEEKKVSEAPTEAPEGEEVPEAEAKV